MIRTSVISLAISAVFATAVSAAQTVAYDREALSDPAAVAVLYADIEKAARKACRTDVSPAPYLPNKLRACTAATLAYTVAEIDSSELTAYATAQSATGERFASN